MANGYLISRKMIPWLKGNINTLVEIDYFKIYPMFSVLAFLTRDVKCTLEVSQNMDKNTKKTRTKIPKKPQNPPNKDTAVLLHY